MGQKADDISVIDGCAHCHRLLDLHLHGLSGEELAWTLLRGLQETIRVRIEAGILPFPHDAPPAIKQGKPRKPKAERAPIKARPTAWPSRPFPARKLK